MVSQSKEQLINTIKTAFESVRYPGDEKIASNPSHCRECLEADEFFKGKHWKDLLSPQIELPAGYAGLCFLTPQAWHFFLPAYMIHGVLNYESSDAAQEVIFHLDPPQEKAQLFSSEQCLAVVEFFQYIDEHYSQVWPLSRYFEFWLEKSIAAKEANG